MARTPPRKRSESTRSESSDATGRTDRVEKDGTDGMSHRPLIVGVGASAGGIDAVSQLLRQLPADTGLSFVVIQHLAPRRPSQLSAVLARSTAMPVVDAE